MEDILEEIGGDFEDESSLQMQPVRRQSDDGCFYVDPSARLDDLETPVGYNVEPASCNTLAGLIFYHLGRVAQAGDQIDLPGLTIIVEATDGHRLIEVCLKKATYPEELDGNARE